MKWWYENEEDMKSCEHCSHEDCKNIGGTWYCLECPECGVNWERKMEFDKSRIYSAVNADELRAGDKVITANAMADLKTYVKANAEPVELVEIKDETELFRFCYQSDKKGYNIKTALAYLVERRENCTNCGNYEECGYMQATSRFASLNRCEDYKPKTEQKAEPHYRPFRDIDELIKVFCEKTPKIYDKDDEKLFMPYIWVRNKENKRAWLITEFDNRLLDYLFTNCEFLDSSVCGVEE